MSNTITPLGSRVLAVRDKAAEKTSAGIYLPKTQQEASNIATVEAVGEEVSTLKAGDRIIFKEFSATEISIDGTDYLIIEVASILAVLAD